MKTRTKITLREFVDGKVDTKEIDVQDTYHMVVRKMNTIGNYIEVHLKSGRFSVEKSLVLTVMEVETTKFRDFNDAEEAEVLE